MIRRSRSLLLVAVALSLLPLTSACNPDHRPSTASKPGAVSLELNYDTVRPTPASFGFRLGIGRQRAPSFSPALRTSD